jgi:acyl-homoserine lactone acylase PvdQ
MELKWFAAIAAAVALVAPTTAVAATPAPYGTNDAGGFRNVLPTGEAGTDTAFDLANFTLTGTRPDHWSDQEPLYDGLLYASPNITAADVDKYYKDATFGVKPDDVASTESPRAGVTIVRDKAYGVPHIYGDTSEDVEFGAGYAGAEDRLFLMDVLRHTARAQLSSFAGGSAGNRAMDRAQWLIAPYTEADLQKQIDNAVPVYGQVGAKIKDYGQAFVDGINAYIAQLNPATMPAEYAAFGQTPQPWKLTDVIAEASLIGGIFGKGGGNELRSALALEALQKRFGKKKGTKAWSDFRFKNDPEAPTTVLGKRFPYETASAFSKRGLALPDPGSVKFVDDGPPLSSGGSSLAATATSSRFGQIPNDGSIGSTLLKAATTPHASNWELIPARSSASGHPIGVLGPQVGYYDPQILMEEDLHGPGFDARGASFPGVNLMVQLGHGRDYAWSATTATSDNVDTFAEVLCQDDHHYLYKGQCLPMDKLEVTNSWSPSVGDPSDGSGSETLTAWRTVHGIEYATGTVHGKKVAFVSARTTYMHEADSSIGFFCLNDPACTHDYPSFRKAVGGINFAFNWGYIDSNHIGYQLSGAYPQRAKGTSPDFPILGTGQYDWRGFNKDLFTMKTVPLNAMPHVEDQKYLVSWNNKQAPGWAAADDKYTFGPIYRQQMIADFVRRAIKKGKVQLQQLVQAMEEPATQDIRGLAILPIVEHALGKVKDPALRDALAKLDAWRRAGAHRRDLNKDKVYDDSDAVVLMDAWWPTLVDAEFHKTLGDNALAALRAMAPFGDERGGGPAAPDFADGWYGQVSKDLRDLFARRSVRGRWSRIYCGGGSKTKCRAALLQSLRDALQVTPQEMYGHGDCASDPTPYCNDLNRFTTASAISNDPMLFQNRPTFQQAVEIPKQLPR